MMLFIATAVLGFSTMPPHHEDHAHEYRTDTYCDKPGRGHTGNLAVLYAFANFGCDQVSPGYNPDAPWSCLLEDGGHNFLTLQVGGSAYNATGNLEPGHSPEEVKYDTYDLCPETCGHGDHTCPKAPTEDVDPHFIQNMFGMEDCGVLAGMGYCGPVDYALDRNSMVITMRVSWLCPESCGQWDDCKWQKDASAADQYEAACPTYTNGTATDPADVYYYSHEECMADMNAWVAEDLNSDGSVSCAGDDAEGGDGSLCYLGMGALGSTEVHKCDVHDKDDDKDDDRRSLKASSIKPHALEMLPASSSFTIAKTSA